jgi:molybdopterin-guanine dinucleotide biosynthesis protein A
LITAALILAGGQGRRLGGADKVLLDLAGRPILDRLVDTLRPVHGLLAISANGDPARFAATGLPVLPDGAFAGEGPLAGILAGLDWAAAAGAEALLSVPGDTPFIPPDLAARLAPPPACAASDEQAHHLVALWPVAARARLRAVLAAPGSRRVRDFAAMIGMRTVPVGAAAAHGFLNVNTPADLAEARAIAEEEP